MGKLTEVMGAFDLRHFPIIATMCSLVLVAVSNLASMPTKYTIPFFVLGILMDLVVVVLSFFIH